MGVGKHQLINRGAGANPASGPAMFLLKFPGGRRRKQSPTEPLPPRERQKDGFPPFGNITGLELMALFMSR